MGEFVDAVSQQQNIKNIDFIKIDIECFEMDILNGLLKMVKIIQFEYDFIQ